MRPELHIRQQQGLTLVELMIALTLGLIVITALVVVFSSSNQNYRQNEALASLQDNARFALDAVSRDLAMAGYWGGVRPIDAGTNIQVSAAARPGVAKASAGGDCGPATQASGYDWLFDVATAIVFRNHLAGTAINADFTCLLPADIQPNTDVLMIRRVSGIPTLTIDTAGTQVPATANTVASRFYVKTNQNTGTLYRAVGAFSVSAPLDCPDSMGLSAPCPPTANPVQVYAYTPQIYYIRNHVKPGDGIPMLCRRYLDDTSSSTASMVEDCLAEGVENLQIEWGIDNGSSGVNYLFAPTPAQLESARMARIHILVRTTSQNVQGSNDAKSFILADFTSPSQAGVLRRAFTTTVQLKNFQP
ncbi:MAG: PilW family protein [Pseudomonadota bacterium]